MQPQFPGYPQAQHPFGQTQQPAPAFGAPAQPAPQPMPFPGQTPAPFQPAPQQAPGGFPGYPGQAPGQYGPPAQAPGYGAPQGYPQQGFAPAPFVPQANSLDNTRDPPLPFGDHRLEIMSAQRVGQGADLLIVACRVLESDNPHAVGQIGAWKRGLNPAILGPGGNAIISNDLAGFAIPASGRTKEQIDLAGANALIGELVARMTLDGRPLVGRFVRCRVYTGTKPNKKRPGEFHTEHAWRVA
jgi:hypothetical protein